MEGCVKEQQIQQQLDWLEEKRKQDGQTLALMQQQLNEFESRIDSVRKSLSDVPAELSRLSEKVARMDQLDDALVKQREDIARQLQEFHKKREKREKQKEALEKKAEDYIQKDIRAIQEEVEKLGQKLDKADVLEGEIKRLSATNSELGADVSEIQQKLEESMHKDAVFEQGRQNDTRRLAEMAAEIATIREKQEKHLVFQENTQTRSRRLEEQINKILAQDGERREELDLWKQQQQARLLDYERSWKEWTRRFEAFEENAETIEDRIKAYQETYLAMKKVNQEMTDLMDKLERRVSEISEMQRLSEDRLKKDLNIFLADDQKRWNMFKLTYDEQWREHDRTHQKLQGEVDTATSTAESMKQSHQNLERFNRKMVLDLLAAVRDWTADLEE